MSDHNWVLENLAAYGAGGLNSDERGRIERHTSGCQGCGKALAEARGLDHALESLFADVRPAPGLESRMIEGLRAAPRGPQPIPRWVRVAACVAAVVFLGLVGFAAHQMGLGDNSRLTSSNNLKQVAVVKSHGKPNGSMDMDKDGWAY